MARKIVPLVSLEMDAVSILTALEDFSATTGLSLDRARDAAKLLANEIADIIEARRIQKAAA